MTTRVVVVVKSGCHLCDDACAIVSRVCHDAGVGWETSDLDQLDESSQRRWAEYVPVVVVDGEVHDVFRVDAERLRTAIA